MVLHKLPGSDAHEPCSITRVSVSSLGESSNTKLYYKEVAMVAKLVIVSPSTGNQLSETFKKLYRAAFFTVGLFRGPCLHSPLKWD